MIQLGNQTFAPTSMGLRVAARLIQGAIFSLPYWVLMLRLGSYGGIEYAIYYMGVVELFLVSGLPLLLAAVACVIFFTKSTTLGGLILGFTYVATPDGGDRNGGKLFLKYFLSSLMEGATFGLITISYLVTYRDGQHWLDRSMGLVAVKRSSRQTVSAGSFGQAQSPAVPAGGVLPVQLPQRSGPVPPMAPQQQAPGFPAMEPAGQPTFPPMQSQPSAAAPIAASAPAPAAPTFAPAAPAAPVAAANPWALPTTGATPKPTPVPVSTFAPSGQPEITKPAPPRISDLDRAMAEDATVLDMEDDAGPAAAVVLDDGQVLTLESPVVLGRNPVAPASHPLARVVQVTDESMRVSKTHLLVAAVGDQVKVVDLGATNGIHIEADGAKTRLEARGEQALIPGTVVHFGGRSLRLAP